MNECKFAGNSFDVRLMYELRSKFRARKRLVYLKTKKEMLEHRFSIKRKREKETGRMHVQLSRNR